MTVMVALLRGVNVGGKNKVAMADLREVASACGFEHVRTYIQSGNLLFATASSDTPAVAAELRSAIADELGVDTPVVVRTREELSDVVAASPYAGAGPDPSTLHVVFVDGTAPAEIGRAHV